MFPRTSQHFSGMGGLKFMGLDYPGAYLHSFVTTLHLALLPTSSRRALAYLFYRNTKRNACMWISEQFKDLVAYPAWANAAAIH